MGAAEAARGERLIGVRLGGAVTRSAPWRIADRAPELGWLTGSRRLAAGQPAPGQLIDPQAVPHLAFVLGGPLTGPGVARPARWARWRRCTPRSNWPPGTAARTCWRMVQPPGTAALT